MQTLLPKKDSSLKYGSVDKSALPPVSCQGSSETNGDVIVTGPSSLDEADETIVIDNAVDLLGIGMFHYVGLITTGLCFMADSMEVSLLSFLAVTLKEEWELTAGEAATITSLVFLGEIGGSLFWGRLGDKYGRRPVFLAAAITICVAGVGTSLVTDYVSLIIMRFTVGVGVGGLTVPFDVFAEFLPLESRGQYLNCVGYFWSAGSAIVAAFAYFTLSGEVKHWRVFVFLCAIPSFISSILCWYFIPESPRWLLSQGRRDDAMKVLRNIADRNGNHGVYNERLVLKDTHEVENSSFSVLLSAKWRQLTLLLWGVWFGFGFSYNGVVLAITRVFQNNSAIGDTVTFNFGAIFISALAETVGVVIASITVDRLGRISSQVAYFSLAGIAVTGMLFLGPSSEKEGLKTLCAFVARAFEISANCITWITAAEVLTTEIRATGHSAANAMCRVGAVLTSYAVEGDTTLHQLAYMMIFVHALEVFCCVLLPETKGLALGDRKSVV